jgi:beta-galactosidase
MKRLLVFCMLLAAVCSAERMSFDESWRFQLGDPAGAEAVRFDDASWRTLDVPHDWSIEGEYSKDNPMGGTAGYLPAGIGWYRKTIPVSKDWKGKHVEIAFDGVFMNSTVWVNGEKLGTRPYGWSSFSYDISDAVKTAGSITIAVRVDNEKQPAARWYTGSGIYAHTWLDVKETIHVKNTFFQTLEADERRATVQIDTKVVGDADADVTHQLFSKDWKKVAEGFQTLEIKKPQLWSPDEPNLYTLRTIVKSAGKVVDQVDTRVGIRTVEWVPETGMWLNGKNVKLQGVCNHQDAGALGAAVPDKVLRFRIEQLKAMGCNAIRTSHNPQTPIFYELCDEIGMLVMDEIFDGWKKKAAHDYGRYFFDQWWERDVRDWIQRDRNHPCVVIYSVGNETGGAVAKDLVRVCHEEDPTRPVTSGHSGDPFMDVLGVNGGSERVGWFDTLEKDRVFIGTENTHTWQVRGYYRTKTWYRDGFKGGAHEIPDLTEEEVFTHDWIKESDRGNRKQVFNSSYDNATVRLNSRKNIELLRDVPNYAGSFRWTGYDYIGEASYVHGGWPFKAFMGGAIDLANFEKDLYYLYQSQWTDEPMVHILPHWTHPMVKEGTEIPVWVYSNCEQVELFFNGKSLGKQKPGTDWDEMQCQWMVPWAPGELKAVATQGRTTVEKIIRTADAPAKIALSVDGKPLAETGKDLVQVRVTTTDEKGEMVPYGENRTFFKVIGPAKIRALDNGSPVDVEKHFEAESRMAFYGLTRAYVESTGEAGDIALVASCILGEKKQITSNLVSIDTQVLALRGTKPEMDVTIFYTTDGSDPSDLSDLYTGSFFVPLGTTVKALVVVDGKPFQTLEERFAMNEGFVWNGGASAVSGGTPGSEQAEDATLSGATVQSGGKGFRGKGFIDFGQSRNGYVEWYQENDGEAGPATLTIRYSGNRPNKVGQAVRVTVNGKVVADQLMLPNAKNWGSDWKTVAVGFQIERGANTIRITSIGQGGMYIDEILIK